jgi:hypothetical protein
LIRKFPSTERFEPLGLLGSGAFGDVFRVHDRQWDRIVALKTLRRMQPRALLRFKSEFRSIHDIRHDNLVQVHELFGEGDTWYFTMEYIDGLDLTTWLGAQRGGNAQTVATAEFPDIVSWEDASHLVDEADEFERPLAEPGAIRDVFSQIAQGLRALHAVSLIHRDLKPQNVLVDGEGRVRLLDFGLAELLATPHTSIDARGVAGTPGYMAPEVRRGEAVTEAADWYGFGAMLHQVLWGVLPAPVSVGTLTDPAYASLASLCGALCAVSPEQRPSGAAVLEALQVSAPVADPRRAGRALVGRRDQLAFLESRFQEARTGPAVVFLMGESGVGKTALAHRFLTDAHTRHRALVLSGRCYEEMSVPLRALDAIVDALAHRLSSMGESRVRALLPRFLSELAQIFPVLGWLTGLAEPSGRSLPLDPREVRFRAFVALRDLLGRLADARPMVIFLDDLQWGDAASAGVLLDLLLAPDAPQLLLLGTCRSEESHDAPFVRAFQSLDDRPWMHRLTVPPLSPEESQRMAALLLGDVAPEADVPVGEAAGNPMFVELLVQWGRSARDSAVPSSLQGALRDRIEALEDSQRELLELVAVAGQPMSQRTLLEAAPRSSPLDFGALKSQRLIRTRQLDQQPGAVSYHDRIREATVAWMGAERQRALSAAIAEAMLVTGEGDAGQLALRFDAAGDPDRAFEHAVVAADQAFEALLFDRAARFYELALAGLTQTDPRRERLAARCAEALIQINRAADAAPLCEEVARHRGGDPDWQRRAAEQWISSGQTARGVGLMRELLEASGFRWPAPGRSLGLHIFLQILSLRLLDWRAPDAMSPKLPDDSPEDSQGRITLCWSACRALISTDVLRGLYYLARGVRLSIRARDARRFTQFGVLFYTNLAYHGIRWGEDRFARCETISEALADPYLIALVRSQRGYIDHSTGRQPEAVASYRQSVQIFEEACRGVGWESTGTRSNCFNAMMWVGDLEGMSDFIEEGRARAEHLNDWMARCAASLYGSFVEQARDQVERVEASLELAYAIASQEGFATWDVLAALHRLRFDLYRRAGDWSGMEALWSRITAENLHMVPALVNQALDLRASVGCTRWPAPGRRPRSSPASCAASSAGWAGTTGLT